MNATVDKTPMYEMSLIFVLGVGILGLGRAFFCIWVLGVGFLSQYKKKTVCIAMIITIRLLVSM